MWRGLFSAEHVQEPFPSELRPSAVVHDLVVFEDFLLDVDIAMLGILGVQDVGSVLLELDMPLAQQTVQGHGTAHPKLFGDLRCRIRFSDMGKDGHTSLSLHAGLALFASLISTSGLSKASSSFLGVR